MAGPDAPLAALEALIFCGAGPAALRRALGFTPGQIAGAVKEINVQLEQTGRPYEIVEVAGSYLFRTRPEFGELLAAAQPERKLRLSRAALDTLAVVAYRQPVSRPEIEEVRSVDCGAVLKSLMERGLVRIVGRRDAPGRPALYGTSAAFLETFGLKTLRDLPDLRDLMPSATEATPLAEALGRVEPSEEDEQGDVEPEYLAEDLAEAEFPAEPEPEPEPDAANAVELSVAAEDAPPDFGPLPPGIAEAEPAGEVSDAEAETPDADERTE